MGLDFYCCSCLLLLLLFTVPCSVGPEVPGASVVGTVAGTFGGIQDKSVFLLGIYSYTYSQRVLHIHD